MGFCQAFLEKKIYPILKGRKLSAEILFNPPRESVFFSLALTL
ncbi:hypothetical protein C789_5216 [Microcystis aeruginosa FACHB-905 = DIANCHI905]|nr:hypothetical protein C789_5216 [Microcystis aeruginosa FACHB-905 = DIANCHI905]